MIWPTISHTPKNKHPITVFKNSIVIGRDLPKSEKPPSVVVDLDPPSRSPSCERVVSTNFSRNFKIILWVRLSYLARKVVATTGTEYYLTIPIPPFRYLFSPLRCIARKGLLQPNENLGSFWSRSSSSTSFW